MMSLHLELNEATGELVDVGVFVGKRGGDWDVADGPRQAAQSKRLKKVDSTVATSKSVSVHGRYSFTPFASASQAVWTYSDGWSWGHLSHKAPVEQEHVGKWMAQFFGEGAVTWGKNCFELARDVFKRGQLGPTMKFGVENFPESCIVIFYTNDSRDVADVLRVLTSLRSFIPRKRLNYKVDERTLSNCYAKNCTDGDLCLYHSPKSDDEDTNKPVVLHQNRPVRKHNCVVSDVVGVHLPLSHCVEVAGEVQPRERLPFDYTSCALGPKGVSFVGALR